MTGRDLSSLLERASEAIPELDFAEPAWGRAVADQQHRRRVLVGSVGALAAAVLAVTAVQSASRDDQPPQPLPATATTGERLLPDNTAYALMPLEGTERRLPLLEVGLPERLDLDATPRPLSRLGHPPESVVAVYLRAAKGGYYQPVLVTGRGDQLLVDTLTLEPLVPPDGRTSPLGVRAVGGGSYVVFAQPGAVVRLDLRSGAVSRYAVPDQELETAAFTSDQGTILARSPSWTWAIDPWQPGTSAVAAGTDAYEGSFRVSPDPYDAGHLVVRQQDQGHQAHVLLDVRAPVTDVWGETVNTDTWAATGVFFDQDAVHSVIRGRYGVGPIYQGLVAVDLEALTAHLLLAPENPDGQTGRFKGCCTVLGWADGHTVLYESRGVHGRWVLAWDVESGTVSRVTQVVGGGQDGSPQPPLLALNVGWRY